MAVESDKSDFLEPYRIAIKLEQEGRRCFLEAAQKTSSDLARQTFEFLAKEEQKHIRQIESFYKALKASGGKEIPEIEESDAEVTLELFQKRLESIKDEFEATDSDLEAYQMALKLEDGAEEFYQEMLDKTDNPGIRKFYSWLIQEEAMHGRLINSCLKFVEDPTAWFKKRRG